MNEREALERIAKYPMSRSEEMSIETAREIARAALASQAQQTEQEQESVFELLQQSKYTFERNFGGNSLDADWIYSDLKELFSAYIPPASKWFNAEEQLPDHTDDVLCYCIALFEPIATIKTSRLNPAKTGFYVEYDNSGLEPLEKVTHWMPLPPAPEGE